jgi:hypothetical protein
MFGVRDRLQVGSVRLDHEEVFEPDWAPANRLAEQGVAWRAEQDSHFEFDRQRGPPRRVVPQRTSLSDRAAVAGLIPERAEPAAGIPFQVRVPPIPDTGKELSQQFGSHDVDTPAFGATHLGGKRGSGSKELDRSRVSPATMSGRYGEPIVVDGEPTLASAPGHLPYPRWPGLLETLGKDVRDAASSRFRRLRLDQRLKSGRTSGKLFGQWVRKRAADAVPVKLPNPSAAAREAAVEPDGDLKLLCQARCDRGHTRSPRGRNRAGVAVISGSTITLSLPHRGGLAQTGLECPRRRQARWYAHRTPGVLVTRGVDLSVRRRQAPCVGTR